MAATPTAEHLRGLALRSSSDGWAVGARSFILHWNGSV
jgi:hypothetical protein